MNFLLFRFSREKGRAVLGLCLLSGLLLRGFLVRGGLWRDEAQFLFVLRQPTILAMLDFLHFHESHPPLFYLFMRLWAALFGEGSILFPSLLFGLILIPLVYLVGKKVFSAQAGLMAAALVAFSPSLVDSSTSVRPYPLLAILCLLSTTFLFRAARDGRRRDWGFYVAATAAMLFVHHWTWLIFGGQWLMFALSFRHWGRPKAGLLKGWGISQVLILLLYSPWLPVLLFQSRHAGYPPRPLLFFLALRMLSESAFSLDAGIAALLIALIAFLVLRQKSQTSEKLPYFFFLGVPLIAFAGAVGLSLRSDLVTSAALGILTPYLLLLFCQLLSRLFQQGKIVPLSILALLILNNALILRRQAGTFNSNAREVALAVAARSKAQDLVAITPECLASSFNYYYQPQNRQVTFLGEGRKGAIAWDNYALRLGSPPLPMTACFEKARQEGRRVWLIVDSERFVSSLSERSIERAIEKKNWELLALWRSKQLVEALVDLYGQPQVLPVSYPRCRKEELKAFLFSP
ncbi:MAG TPA: glycosyltransferase family 39 protein [Chroococcales cyanobacterium]|jgi:4-amino-4-deoxy-L-arabinose transferase-like glycosyltransferase